MPELRAARITAISEPSAATRIIELTLPAGESLGFIGGQYVQIHTAETLPNGKQVRRPFSIISSDAEQGCFRIAIQKLEHGPASKWVWGLDVGDTVQFLGPIGSFGQFEHIVSPVLLVATDTGVTAMLGVLQSRAYQPFLSKATLVWCTASADDFLSDSELATLLPDGLHRWKRVLGPPVGTEDRWARVKEEVGAVVREIPAGTALLAGDGDIVVPGREKVMESFVLTPERVSTEIFFNKPGRE